jgi:hypothetical protein
MALFLDSLNPFSINPDVQQILVNDDTVIESTFGSFNLPHTILQDDPNTESLEILGSEDGANGTIFRLNAPNNLIQQTLFMELFYIRYNMLDINIFQNLESIHIENCNFTNVNHLFTIPSLKSLYVKNTPITNINVPIGTNVDNLEELVIQETAISTFPNFNLFTSLKDLTFSSQTHTSNLEEIARRCTGVFTRLGFSQISLSVNTNEGPLYVEIHSANHSNTPKNEENLLSILRENTE